MLVPNMSNATHMQHVLMSSAHYLWWNIRRATSRTHSADTPDRLGSPIQRDPGTSRQGHGNRHPPHDRGPHIISCIDQSHPTCKNQSVSRPKWGKIVIRAYNPKGICTAASQASSQHTCIRPISGLRITAQNPGKSIIYRFHS